MGYYDSYNPDLLKFIPPDATDVMEIGCGEGALCEAYRRINPNVYWVGIEPNCEAADRAEFPGRCDDVIRRTWKEVQLDDDMEPYGLYLPSEQHKPGEHTVLIMGDVLEHMVDPWDCLETEVGWLPPGSTVLASVPNVQHWSVIRDLLNGKWEYTDSGLMDRTHLRFFTLDSIRKMFADAGLQVFEIVGRDLFNQGWEEFIQIFEDGSPSSQLDNGIKLNELRKTSQAYQYIVRAVKPERWRDRYGDSEQAMLNPPDSVINPIDSAINRMPKLHIHAVTAEACCARPRILEPFAMLQTIPGVKCTTSSTSAIPDAAPDILVMQRARTYSAHYYKAMIEKGRLLIAEIDDEPKAIGVDPVNLRAVHAVQCSTEALAEVCRKYNPNVMVFPNQIAELPPIERPIQPPDCAIRIFFGAQNREADWAAIMPAINRIGQDLPSLHIRFIVVHDRTFFDALDVPSKEFHPFLPYDEYRKLLRTCDIALLPLEDTPFNRCKSDIKFLECAVEGIACVMTCLAFNQLGAHNKISTAIAWPYFSGECFEEGLRLFIEDAEYRQGMAKAAYAYARDNRLLSQHYRARYEWYQSLLSSKQALDHSLLERCPELAPQLSSNQC